MSLEALSDYIFQSKYSKYRPDLKRRETYQEAVERVKIMHLRRYPQVRDEIEWAFNRVHGKRVLPSMRSMQFGGKPCEDKNARIYNCTSSYCDRVRFFQEAFWLLLCGCGVGFSVQHHHIARLPNFYDHVRYTGTDMWSGRAKKFTKGHRTFVIPDTIEGWADALGVLLATYMPHPEYPEWEGYKVVFDCSKIRPEGSPISHGGKAPGPEPLRKALELIRSLIERCLTDGQERLRSIDCYDIVMHASDAVLSGGVRRSATICIFSVDDEDMRLAKTGNWFVENPQRARSNNSAVLLRGQTAWEEFWRLIEATKEYGDPGFYWSDSTEVVPNPCVEIGLYPYDIETGETGWAFCNLCEINGKLVHSEDDFYEVAIAASIIGTLQAGYTRFPYLGPVTERIVRREALLGVSMTGIMENPHILLDPLVQRTGADLIRRTNEEIAAKIGINASARNTCVKPSGTAACVLGTSSGIHAHHSRRYFRRVQGSGMEPVLQHFKRTNPRAVERSVWGASGKDEILTFLVEAGPHAKTKQDVSALDLLAIVRSTQENWVVPGTVPERCAAPFLMHNVSNTINVQDGEWEAAARYIYENQQFFSGVAMLADTGDVDYPQAPMVAVYNSEEIYDQYGVESGRGYSLILDSQDAYGGLWAACDSLLGITPRPSFEDAERDAGAARQYDWCRRAEYAADVYFGRDVRRLTHFLKRVWAWDEWVRLKAAWKEVDYTTLIEEEDATNFTSESACAGGKCEI